MSLNTNPESRRYRLAARQRFEDAEILLGNRRTNGSSYLAGFAVECILKTLILANSTPNERPKLCGRLRTEYGHDLEALRKAAGRRGMHMPQDVMEEFRRLNTWHNNNRYDPRLQSTEDAEVVLAASGALVEWAARVGGKADE